MNRTLCSAVSFVLLLDGVGQARADFVTLSFPGANDTYAYGVSGGNVAGLYYAGNPLSVVHSFLYNGSAYTTLTFPFSGNRSNKIPKSFSDDTRYRPTCTITSPAFNPAAAATLPF